MCNNNQKTGFLAGAMVCAASLFGDLVLFGNSNLNNLSCLSF
jgi:hypothetical protein